MIIFIDLDGTLTDTAEKRFKPYKDGLEDFDLTNIPIFDGAKDFVEILKNKDHRIIILSDSHPKYVSKLAQDAFNVEFIYLSDKPNIRRTMNFIESDKQLSECFLSNKDEFIVIGDSSLDIEIARKLKIRSILLSLYNREDGDFDEDDKIESEFAIRKMGPTYYAKSYSNVIHILDNPITELLSIEAAFKSSSSVNAIRFYDFKINGHYQIIRCLARQENGSCDLYARADQYYQIDNAERTNYTLEGLARGAQEYLQHVIGRSDCNWDYFTYISDKSSTTPPNKLKEIFDLVNVDIMKQSIINWSNDVSGSLRGRPDYNERKKFLEDYLILSESIEYKDKNIIILDDQLTTGATAFYIINKLKSEGANNIIFVTLFQMILKVDDGKVCPKCGRQLDIKINKKEGTKFYTCTPPKYRGEGCGYTENI